MTPEEWEDATIGAVASFIGSGVTPRGGSSVYTLTGVPFLRSQNVHFGGLRLDDVAFIEEALHGEMRRSHVQPRDVLLNITGASIGRCTSVPDEFGPANVNQHVCIIRCMPDRTDPRFIAQFLGSPVGQNEIAARQAGLSREALNYEQIRALHLLLPPLGEQRKIAAILSSVDDAIEATQAVIDQLQVAKKAMMAELLTRGLPGHHTRFKQTEIGEVPDEWEVVALGDITSESAFGPRFPSADYDASGNFGTLRTTDVSDDWEIDYSTIPKASLDPALFSSHVLQEGDLLVTRSGTCGVVTVFERQATDVIPGAFLIRFRLREGVNPRFVRLAMMEARAQARVQAMAAGGVQKNLSGTNLAKLSLPKPPAAEQARIVGAIDAVDSRRRSERTALDGLRAVKSALMSVLLTGEVRVTPDRAAA